MNPQDGPQSIRLVSGTVPGVLDPTQPSRILQTQASVLSFASYEPRAATSEHIPDFGKLSLDDNHYEHCRPKRIVIETIPGRGNFWRFVPNAVREQYVEEEGTFPRLIKICGQLCECSQEQWDIYKLDPKYECCVKAFPALSVINLKQAEPAPTLSSRHINKRRTISTPKLQQESLRSTPFQNDICESEQMIIDDDNNGNPKPAPRLPRSRKSPRSTRNLHFEFASKPVPSQPQPKRKADISFHSLRPLEEEENSYFKEDAHNRNTKTYTPKIKKRARTLSPSSQLRTLEAKRTERERKKAERREQEKEFRKQQRERRFMSEALSEVPQAHFYNTDYCDFPDIQEEDAFMEENSQNADNTNHDNAEVDDANRLAESLQKMADLEADRPLWEVAKTKREACERAQEEQQRAKSEARKSQQREKQRDEGGEEARLRQEQDQNRRREEAIFLERERLDRERRARYDQWNSGAWTTYRALERYRLVCQYFDKTKFSETYPLTFHDIPWPTLQSPFRNSPQDMTWEAIQGFFMVAKTIIRGQAYRDLLKSSVSRFHTDRWQSRKLLESVVNVEERDCIEVAVDSVGKSLGNLWDEWKSSN